MFFVFIDFNCLQEKIENRFYWFDFYRARLVRARFHDDVIDSFSSMKLSDLKGVIKTFVCFFKKCERSGGF